MHMTSLPGYDSEVSFTSVNMIIKISGKQSLCSEFWLLIVRVDCFQDCESFFMNLSECFFSFKSCFCGFAGLSELVRMCLVTMKPVVCF